MGCGQDDVTTPQTVNTCVDFDGDGLGTDCVSGPDCDDQDFDPQQANCPKQACDEGATARPCFDIPTVAGGQLVCQSGLKFCSKGVWTTCQHSVRYTIAAPSRGLNATSFSAAISGPVTCNPCNPDCYFNQDYPVATDLTASNSSGIKHDPASGGIVLLGSTSGGGSTALVDSDGDGVPNVGDDFPNDPPAGPFRDGVTENGGIFHVLPYSGPAVYDPLRINTRVRTADVYFLMDTTGSMQQEIDNLKASLTTGTLLAGCARPGLIGAVNCIIPDAEFGVGYFDDIPWRDSAASTWPHGAQPGTCNDAATGTTHDLPYANLQDITSDKTRVTAAVGKLVAKCGQDTPESQLPALFSIATGGAIPSDLHVTASSFTAVNNRNETKDTAYDIGDVTNSFKGVWGNTKTMVDDYSYLGCGAQTSPDAVFKFNVTAPTDVVISTRDSRSVLKTIIHLRDSNFQPITCESNTYRTTNDSVFYRYLQPGTYYLVLEGSGTYKDEYYLSVGKWPRAMYVPARTAGCPAGRFGYPCFRDGSLPVVVLLTDARFHGGPEEGDYLLSGDTDNDYIFTMFRYHQALEVLGNKGIKVIGVNSDDLPDQDCSYPCEIRHQETVCAINPNACLASHEEEVCTTKRVCQGGSCYNYVDCDDETICDRRGSKYECDDEWVCDRYSTTQVCEYEWEESQYQMRQLASDTGAIDENGEPLVYAVGEDGTGLSEKIVEAIARLAGASRMSVALRINNNAATAIDETKFVASVDVVDNPRCIAAHRATATTRGWYEGCLPGTRVEFNVGFKNDHVMSAAMPQVFNFTIDTVGDGHYVLDTTPVRIVVPPGGAVTTLSPGSYWRDYGPCAVGSSGALKRPVWGNLEWDVNTPAGTSIQWQIRSAQTAAGLATATPVTINTPPTVSPVSVDTLLRNAGKVTSLPYLRVTALLNPTADGLTGPTLRGFSFRYTCTEFE